MAYSGGGDEEECLAQGWPCAHPHHRGWSLIALLTDGYAEGELSSQEKVKGHNITRIVGLETFGIVADALAADAKRLFACTTNVSELPGRNSTGKEIQAQGHVGNRLLEHIHEAYAVDRKYISVKKSGKKGK